MKFLHSSMDHPVSQRCRIYQLEEIRIKAGETPDELVERIRGLANRCNFPTDAEKERHIQFQMVCALSDTDLIRKLLAMKIEATTAEMLAVCHTHIGIADDIIIHGKDAEEHDRRLHKFMKVTREHGLVLNKKKCEVKNNSVKFFGCVYDKHGADPDPSKVSAIKEMPAPQNKGELQSFLGMVTYLSPFIPQLSSHTATLRGLLKTDVEYSWNATYQVAFDKLKSLVCEDTTLRYFNTKKPVTIQVDASGKGLGATLIQDDGPVAFASKALTPTEQRYANNERELLACIFGAERFRTYVLVDTSRSRVTTNH